MITPANDDQDEFNGEHSRTTLRVVTRPAANDDQDELNDEQDAEEISVRSLPAVYVSSNPTQVEFPLVRTSAPGSVPLTNERIGEILDQEDLDSIKR